MTQYVGIIQQGMVLDQRVVGVGADEAALQAEAEQEAKKINDAMTGESEGYTAVVLPVPPSK